MGLFVRWTLCFANLPTKTLPKSANFWDAPLTNFVRPVFPVRTNLVFGEIRYKRLGYKTSPLYITVPT